MRNPFQRHLFTYTVAIFAGACGAGAGYFLGHLLALKEATRQISIDTGSAVAVFSALAGCALGFFWIIAYRRNGTMEAQLRRAMAKDKLQVVYQPIVNLASEEIVGAEALARWTDNEGRSISPEVFIRIAEERGFVGEITRLVLNRALSEFKEIFNERPDFCLAVNVSAFDLSDPKFLPMLSSALQRHGVQAKNVVIELTETCAARGEVAFRAIDSLRRAGHQVHIDDFGTGCSSLSYLSDLAVDAIKIDRSFTRAIGTESVSSAILPQILAMAEALRLRVIVEGVENARQAVYFSACARPIFAQGWFYGQAVPLDEFRLMMAARHLERFVEQESDEETRYALPVNAG
jgi:sensor c-di-GMP phosphodiesterase-like protein